jgi:hypothetical protein
MTKKKESAHEAAAAATGYLFQCRFALLKGLEAISDRPELELTIEKFDDVAFVQGGSPVELIQTKHHIAKTGNLTDASVDLWKTLGIWARQVAADVDKVFRRRFILVTTGAAPEGSAASFLRMRDRDEDRARQLLAHVAATSKNSGNGLNYKAFIELGDVRQANLLKAIDILDGSPNIIDIREDICRVVRMAVAKEHLDHFVERLEGWWFGVVINALSHRNSISVMSIDNRVDELREEFRRTALPVDFGGATPSSAVVADLDKRPFVRQLRRINVGSQRIEYAIRDYYRASEQRSKWAREQLLVDGEVGSYEQQLIEAWEPRFAAMVDELPKVCSDEVKVASAQALYKWAEVDALFPLRSAAHRFLTHGSFQILANRLKVRWHPDYSEPAETLDEGKEDQA